MSYNKDDYDPNYTGPRNGQKKKFRVKNLSTPGEFIYYNVNLPSYSGSKMGSPTFCYSATACTSPTNDFWGIGNGGKKCTDKEDVDNKDPKLRGPWDQFSCSTKKSGESSAANASPSTSGSGYGTIVSNPTYHPTDSDLGQGITDFGKRMALQGVGKTWFSNEAPGMGYLHVPIANLNAAQVDLLNKKLAKSQFVTNEPTNAALPLANAGLSPLAGTVLTANYYYNGTLTDPNGKSGAKFPKPPESCGKNYLVTLTDGLPSVTKEGKPTANVDESLAGLLTEVKGLEGIGGQCRNLRGRLCLAVWRLDQPVALDCDRRWQ
ncbi:hypothetical protein LP419_16365 [Massilia sp. H-1]|nr:hypothetical protein LP419_16365 [Massilia sp. H-1]